MPQRLACQGRPGSRPFGPQTLGELARASSAHAPPHLVTYGGGASAHADVDGADRPPP